MALRPPRKILGAARYGVSGKPRDTAGGPRMAVKCVRIKETWYQIALAGLPCHIESDSTVSPFIKKESAARMALSPIVTP